jgi:hypothetical protein
MLAIDKLIIGMMANGVIVALLAAVSIVCSSCADKNTSQSYSQFREKRSFQATSHEAIALAKKMSSIDN